MSSDIFDDLAAEYSRLEGILASLNDDEWERDSLATGWTIADVVTHLALSEEGVATTLARPSNDWTTRAAALDHEMDDAVRDASLRGADAFDRWKAATHASIHALRAADPTVAVRWAAAPLRPRTLATTRLAEHWAHALDIVEPLGISFPDTERLRHVAWLGHATLPYAFRLHGIEPVPVRADLIGPSGDTWAFGPDDAPSVIRGDGAAFCRVGAQRLRPEASGLETIGPNAQQALAVLRNYAA